MCRCWWHPESRKDLILFVNSKAIFFNLLKSMLSFKNINIIRLPLLLFEKIKLDIKIQNNSGHHNFWTGFSKYTNINTHQWRSWTTPATLPPAALRITIQRQSQANDRHKMLADGFARGLGKLRRWMDSRLWLQILLFGLPIYQPPNWRGKLEIWPKLTIVFYWFTLTKTETLRLMRPH